MVPPPPPRGRPTGWIILTGALFAAVIGLAIWAAVLQSDKDEAGQASSARIDELEQGNADLEQQVADLQAQVEALQADADSAAAEAQSALDAAREQYDAVSEELGATNAALEETQAELAQLAADAEAALAEAEGAAATAEEKAAAEAARADLAEACLGAVADVIQRVYEADDPIEALDRAADELADIADDCDAAA